MDTHCVNCGGPDAERVSLTLEGETTISDVRLCAECLGAFQTTEWIHVEDSLAAG